MSSGWTRTQLRRLRERSDGVAAPRPRLCQKSHQTAPFRPSSLDELRRRLHGSCGGVVWAGERSKNEPGNASAKRPLESLRMQRAHEVWKSEGEGEPSGPLSCVVAD